MVKRPRFANGTPLETRLQVLLKSSTVTPVGCLEPSIVPDSRGYPRLRYNGTLYSVAHLVLYGEKEAPKGTHIMHTCGNPTCVNKEHLLAGTSGMSRKMYVHTRKEKNPARLYRQRRERSAKVLYNLTPIEVATLLEAQNSMCAICGTHFTSENPHCVDHDHTTKQLRGLLCHACNLGLGKFKDDVSRLKNAVAYLETHMGV